MVDQFVVVKTVFLKQFKPNTLVRFLPSQWPDYWGKQLIISEPILCHAKPLLDYTDEQ